MANLSRLTIPVKDPSTGLVAPQTFDIGGGSSADVYSVNDSASATINDGDYIPMLDVDGTTKKKSLWSTVIAKIKTALATVATSGDYTDLINTPNLATVATSGNYTDLSNKPTLGTAAAKDSTNAVSSGNTGLVESGAVFNYFNNAVDFIYQNNRLYKKDPS